ncbi:histidine kinase [Microbacterium album]|uniref:Uncharacterized protein n=1 Tax=Microbacterium album TaxID=2053191 RepID=A0A917IDN5_9MICO|nr:histidine kinase [Microbacterium album]GGH37808.1 hypothetical protein GCM10010921_07980 [Microbacterium album]
MAVDMTRPAAVLLAIEAIGLLALAGWEVVALIGADASSTTSGVALIVLTVIGAAAVAGFAVATWRGRSWGRSGGVVTQLLILAVAVGALTGEYPQPAAALGLAVPGVLGLVLLFGAARRAAQAEPHAPASDD